MKSKYLLPNRYKTIGLFFLIPAVFSILKWLFIKSSIEIKVPVFAIVESDLFMESHYFSIVKNFDIYPTLICITLLVGLVMIAFSKENNEDEFISKLRLDSLIWATFINYILLFLALFFVFGFALLWILLFNMFTTLILFIIRFNFILYKNKRLSN